MPQPAEMEIQRLSEGDACFIVYLDSREMILSESWHPSLGAAMYHARWEWGVEPSEWEALSLP